MLKRIDNLRLINFFLFIITLESDKDEITGVSIVIGEAKILLAVKIEKPDKLKLLKINPAAWDLK